MILSFRVYRVHDYDLMVLYSSGIINITEAARRAIIAYYRGEPIKISTDPGDRKIITENLPTYKKFGVTINEDDAPGITKWLKGIKSGYRTSCIKNILRASLDCLRIEIYNQDAKTIINKETTAEEIRVPIRKTKKKILTGSSYVDAVAENKPTVIKVKEDNKAEKEIKQSKTDNDHKDEIKQTKPIQKPVKTSDIDPEDEFDAFDSFNELFRKK